MQRRGGDTTLNPKPHPPLLQVKNRLKTHKDNVNAVLHTYRAEMQRVRSTLQPALESETRVTHSCPRIGPGGR